MAVGCPVIASRTSSIVELGVPDERQALSARLLHQAQRFSWRRFCERTVGAALALPATAAPMADAAEAGRDHGVARFGPARRSDER